ncbi:hypothetical protein FSP39_020070, partial [Pinctada imbricata]
YGYFVYCKKCQSLQPGKLRVICSHCKQGNIVLDTLDREPQGFEDVLHNQDISGECKSDECHARQIAQFYFKCAQHQSELSLHDELDQSEAVLQHVRPNRKQVECITCSEITHHVMCMDCFQSYCIVQLNERRFVEDPHIGYSLPCPAGCPDSLIKDAHHFYLLGKEQYERYKNFGAEEYVLQNGGILCPAIGCGIGFLLEGNSRKITCPVCRGEFCRECRQDYHVDENCTQHILEEASQDVNAMYERELRARWDTASLDTIGKISKPCPNCRTKTERAGGCMHMKCSRCGEDWCWLCETKWNRECQGNHWFG